MGRDSYGRAVALCGSHLVGVAGAPARPRRPLTVEQTVGLWEAMGWMGVARRCAPLRAAREARPASSPVQWAGWSRRRPFCRQSATPKSIRSAARGTPGLVRSCCAAGSATPRSPRPTRWQVSAPRPSKKKKKKVAIGSRRRGACRPSHGAVQFHAAPAYPSSPTPSHP